MAFLQDILRNEKIPLHGTLTIVGRDVTCDIVLDAPTVSSRHFMILNRNGQYSVEDLASMNGTFVNGHSLTRRIRLFSGDRITLVGLSLIFQDDAEAAAEVSSKRCEEIQHPISNIPGTCTIRMSELMDAPHVPELSSLKMDGDLRLSVKPEAKLRAMLEIARSLSHSLELKVVMPQILDGLFAIFPAADCGFVLLRNQQSGELTPSAVKYRRPRNAESLPISRGIVQQVLVSGRAILSHDAGIDSRILATDSIRHFEIRSIMCVPILREDGECMGIIQLDSRDRTNQFNEADLEILACTSLLAARAMEVARLHEDLQELDAATRIQRSLLPTRRPSHTGLQFFDYYAPKQRVSGDYFDYISLSGNRLAVVIADVAGKGMSAALLMAHLAAATRICLTNTSSLADAVRQLNVLMLNSIADDRFITFVVAELDLIHFRLKVINAGHPPPLLRRGRQETARIDELDSDVTGLPLGVRDCPYHEFETNFERGDTLLLYTDGVIEMRNTAGKLYGIERLNTAILAAPNDAEKFGIALIDDLQRFAQSRLAGDDVTLLCLRRTD